MLDLAAMAKSPYDADLDRNPANFQPLTPLTLLERAASVFPDQLAIVHGPLRRSYREFYARARKLASALAKRGIGRGDTVSAVLANTPAMLECHYGVPMAGAVLNTINTRLDAAVIAFQLDHGDAKVLITDREFAKVVKEALALCKVKPLIVDYDDPEFSGAGERLGAIEYEDFIKDGDPEFRLGDAGRRMGRHHAQLHLGHHRRPQGRGLSPPRRLSARRRQRADRQHAQALRLSLDAADVPLQRLVLSLDDLGGRRHPCLPAPGPRQGDVRRHRRAQGDASVRRADRDGDPAQRAGRREEAAAAHDRVLHRGRAAAGGGARRDEGGGLQRHPRLWADGNLRPRDHQRMERRLGQAAAPSRRRRRRARACAMCRSKRSTCSIPTP